MKIGVFSVLFSHRPFSKMLDYIKEAGCEAVEIGTGGYPGDAIAGLTQAAHRDAQLEGLQSAQDLSRGSSGG